MAKKPAKTAPKKRKHVTAAPREVAETAVLGTVTIPVQTSIYVGDVANFNELVIEWGCLGLSEEPDKITEASGNQHLLDPNRPPTTDDEGLHIFFNPPLAGHGATYGFLFHFTYNDSVEARTAAPVEQREEVSMEV